MKRLFLCIAALLLFVSIAVNAAEFSSQKLEITGESGKIAVSGSFSASEAGETYQVFFATYDEDGLIEDSLALRVTMLTIL